MARLTEFRKRIIGEGAWVVVGYVVGLAAMLVGIRLITQFVSRQEYGIFTLGIAAVAMAIQVFYGPFFSAGLRFYPEMRSPQQLAVLRRTIGGMFLRIVPLVVMAFTAGGFFLSGKLGVPAMMFIFAGGLLALAAVRDFEYTLLGAARRQKIIAICTSLETLCKQGLAIVAVYLLWRGFGGIFCGYLAGDIIVVLTLILFVRREGTQIKGVLPDPNLRRQIVKYALPLMPVAIVGWVISLGDRYIINGMIGPEAVGLYAASYGLAARMLTVPVGIVGQILRPVYFKSVADGNNALTRRIFTWWFGILAIVSLVSVAAIFWLKDIIAWLFLAESFRGGSSFMPWVAAGAAMLALCDPFTNRMLAAKRTGILLGCNFICSLVCVGVTIWFVKLFGLIGAAMACPVYYGVQFAALILASLFVKLPVGQMPQLEAVEQKLADERENAGSL